MGVNKIDMEEIWKDIPGYYGIYEVSNKGRVKSVPRIGFDGRRVKGRFLKKVVDGAGYYTTALRKNNIQKTFKFHQLVAMAFLGHTLIDKNLVVNHIDFCKTNNEVINLEIVTRRENSNLKHIKSSSKYVGVDWYKDRVWRSRITIKGKLIDLGYFKNEIEASNSYKNKLKQIQKQKQ